MGVEPQIPIAFEIWGTILFLVYGAMVLVALITVAKSDSVSGGQKVAWTLAIVLLPLIGAAAWLALEVTDRRRRTTAGAATSRRSS